MIEYSTMLSRIKMPIYLNLSYNFKEFGSKSWKHMKLMYKIGTIVSNIVSDWKFWNFDNTVCYHKYLSLYEYVRVWIGQLPLYEYL